METRSLRGRIAAAVGLLVLCAVALIIAASLRAVTPQVTGDHRLRQALFEELQPTRLANCEFARFGETHDGGYLLCRNLLGSVQVAYSYGVDGYDGWGCDVSRQLHVRVHQYDCFNLRRPVCPGGDTAFHEECVGPERRLEDGRRFDSLGDQLARNGDTYKHVLVKMDIEGDECRTLLATPDKVLAGVDQVAMEFHGARRAADDLEILRKLKRTFYVAHVHFNNCACDRSLRPLPAWAYEVLLVNKRIARVDYLARIREALGLTGPGMLAARLDAPNDPSSPDCQTVKQ